MAAMGFNRSRMYNRMHSRAIGSVHLSYVDLTPLANLDRQLADKPISQFALDWARQSFDRLQKDIRAEITVASHDIDSVGGYVNSVDSVYGIQREKSAAANASFVDHCDCAEDSAYVTPSMSKGVTILYPQLDSAGQRAKKNIQGGIA